MIIPTKHEDLGMNIIVVGSIILEKVKNKDYFIEEILQECKNQNKNLDFSKVCNALTFLFCIGAIEIDEYMVRIIK